MISFAKAITTLFFDLLFYTHMPFYLAKFIKVQDPRDVINDLDVSGLDVKDVNALDVKDVIEVKTLLPQS